MLFEALPGISVVNFSVSCRMGTDLEGNRLRHPREKASVFWRSGVFRISRVQNKGSECPSVVL